MPSRKSFEPSISVTRALSASRASEVAICHGGITAPETVAALRRSIMLVGAVSGNTDMPTARGEFGVLRNTHMTQNGHTLSSVKYPENCVASRRFDVKAPTDIMMLA